MSLVICPVHGAKLIRDENGVLNGKCWGCAGEAADGIIWLRRHPYDGPLRALADELLERAREGAAR